MWQSRAFAGFSSRTIKWTSSTIRGILALLAGYNSPFTTLTGQHIRPFTAALPAAGILA